MQAEDDDPDLPAANVADDEAMMEIIADTNRSISELVTMLRVFPIRNSALLLKTAHACEALQSELQRIQMQDAFEVSQTVPSNVDDDEAEGAGRARWQDDATRSFRGTADRWNGDEGIVYDVAALKQARAPQQGGVLSDLERQHMLAEKTLQHWYCTERSEEERIAKCVVQLQAHARRRIVRSKSQHGNPGSSEMSAFDKEASQPVEKRRSAPRHGRHSDQEAVGMGRAAPSRGGQESKKGARTASEPPALHYAKSAEQLER